MRISIKWLVNILVFFSKIEGRSKLKNRRSESGANVKYKKINNGRRELD